MSIVYKGKELVKLNRRLVIDQEGNTKYISLEMVGSPADLGDDVVANNLEELNDEKKVNEIEIGYLGWPNEDRPTIARVPVNKKPKLKDFDYVTIIGLEKGFDTFDAEELIMFKKVASMIDFKDHKNKKKT